MPTYVLLAIVGISAAIPFAYRRIRKYGMSVKMLIEYSLLGTIFALIFSRIVFVISMIPSMEKVTITEIIYQIFNGGIVFYGGLFGILFSVWIFSKKRKYDAWLILDSIAPAFPLFHIFGRIGCLLAGCCYGVETTWGVILADDPNVVRFPVQFVESICNLFIFIGMLLMERKRYSYKNNLLIYLFSYSICRFILEFFRGDDIRGIWFGNLSTSQYISLGIIFICCNIIIKKSRKSY